MLRLYVEGVGLCGPGLENWPASRAVLSGGAPYVPAPVIVPPSPLLPPNERRRTVQTVKLALAVGTEAFAQARRSVVDTAMVFASSGGDGETIHEILTELASPEPELSPTRFHNSVHNAPAGYWNIAVRSNAPSSSLCCHDQSFAAGLVEAAAQAKVDRGAVGLVAYDVLYPEPLHSVRPIGTFGVALILSPEKTAAAFAQLDLALLSLGNRETRMRLPALEALRQGTPAARSLPLLAALARNAPQAVALDYVSGIQVGLSLAPITASVSERVESVGASP